MLTSVFSRKMFLGALLLSVWCADAAQAQTGKPCPVVSAPASFEQKGESADSASTPGNRGIVPPGFVAITGSAVRHGVDVSKWQASADFVRVKQCGGSFAYVRISGGQKLDNELEYRAHWSNARSVGLDVGPYHNLTLVNPTRPISSLSQAEVASLTEENVRSAKVQAANFLRQFREVLSLDEKSADSGNLGQPFLPIALDVTARPLSQASGSDMETFGNIYGEAICAWFDTVKADSSFASAPKIIFTMPRLFHDFALKRLSCRGDLAGFWISHRPSDGGTFPLDDTNEGLLNRELCVGDDGKDLCVFEQYTSWGGFALYQPSEGLDLDRFRGDQAKFQTLLYQAKR